jgi:hypothetical protein
MDHPKRYIPGDNYIICDVTGLKVRVSQSRRRWDNALTIKSQCEPRHPQEFVRPKGDKIAADISRPRQAYNFLDTNEVTAEGL